MKAEKSIIFRSESNINFRSQCITMTLMGGWRRGVIANDILEMRKLMEFQSLYPPAVHLCKWFINRNSKREVI